MVATGGCSIYDIKGYFANIVEQYICRLPEFKGVTKEIVKSSWMGKFEEILNGASTFKNDARQSAVSEMGLNPTNSNLIPGGIGDGIKNLNTGGLSLSLATSHTNNATVIRRPANNHYEDEQIESNWTKEQLFLIFQEFLGINRFEHQLLFNACQLDSPDEQTAVIRRELDAKQKYLTQLRMHESPFSEDGGGIYTGASGTSRQEIVCEPDYKATLFHPFIKSDNVRHASSVYLRELVGQVDILRGNLESVPVARLSHDFRSSQSTSSSSKLLSRFQSGSSTSVHNENNSGRDSHPSEPKLSKNKITLKHQMHVVIMEAKGIQSIPPIKQIYCTIELDGADKLATHMTTRNNPKFGTSADFETNCPRPLLKIKLLAKSSNMLQLDDQVLGKIELENFDEHVENPCQWYAMMISSGKDKGLTLQVAIRVKAPQVVKQSGFIWCCGKQAFKKWDKRYVILVQVSQYNFAICEYNKRKSRPVEILQLDGFIVDYAGHEPGLSVGSGGQGFFISMIKEGDSLILATEHNNDRHQWIEAMCRATAQCEKTSKNCLISEKTISVES